METELIVAKVFMTRDDLACVHEPFGDAFYYGYALCCTPETDLTSFLVQRD